MLRSFWRTTYCRCVAYKYRSSHPEGFYKTGVLKNFIKFIEKHLCKSLSLINLLAFNHKSGTLFKKRIQHSCFPVKFEKFLKAIIFRTSLNDFFCTFSNSSKYNPEKNFFTPLKNESTRKAWMAAINWKENIQRKFFCVPIILQNFVLIETGYNKKNYSTYHIKIKGDLLKG